ncbi:MAG: hypothetical protein MZV64_49910 [Ignavibacteriales bacterium]|nr:hypothetical protein [Ignavibacteriales bacterium]
MIVSHGPLSPAGPSVSHALVAILFGPVHKMGPVPAPVNGASAPFALCPILSPFYTIGRA